MAAGSSVDPPSLLAAGERTLTLALAPPTVGMSCEVSYHGADAGPDEAWATFVTSAVAVKKKGFTPSTSYVFRLRVRSADATADSEWSPYSAQSSAFRTAAVGDEAKALARPPSLRCAEAEALTWTWPSVDGAQSYSLEWSALPLAGSWTAVSSALTRCAVRKKNLTPGGKPYAIRVRAAFDGGALGPWSAPSAAACTLRVAQPFKNLLGAGRALVSSAREAVHIDALGAQPSKRKLVALYFSAHWCPPCRAFTPRLAAQFASLKQTCADVELDVVFVSLDRSESAFAEYLAEQRRAAGSANGWFALPWAAASTREKAASFFKVEGIPRLIVFNSAGGIVSSSTQAEALTPAQLRTWSG